MNNQKIKRCPVSYKKKMKQKVTKCPTCGKSFLSLSSHLQRSGRCADYHHKIQDQKVVPPNHSKLIPASLFDSILHKLNNRFDNGMNHNLLHEKSKSNSKPQVIRDIISTNNIDNECKEGSFLTALSLTEDDENCSFTTQESEDSSSYPNQICDKLCSQYNQLQKNRNAIIDPQVIFLSQLLKMLNDTNSPLYLYEKIMDWAIQSVDNGFKFCRDYHSREKLLKLSATVCCLKELAPKHHEVELQTSPRTNVVYVDFEQQCFSLLTCPKLMKDENLSFPNDNPCDYKRKDKNNLSCIEDGDMFQNTAMEICNHPKDFCLGIKFFIDATHTDVHSNWMLDPVMFTFTFFKNNVTRSHDAWRNLGFITHTNQKSKSQNKHTSSQKKIQDYHCQLDAILHSIKQCQDKGGFKWKLSFRNKVHEVRMIPVVMLIVGDAQGNHKLAGMYGTFSRTARVNHSCDCSWLHTDDPKITCSFVNQSTINRLCVEGAQDKLKSISQHNIINAFNLLNVAVHPAGINAMMPSEILHQLFLGIFQYVLQDFFDSFKAKTLCKIDYFGNMVFQFGKRNSDRSIPSFNSRNGFTTLTKKSGNDILGTGLVCFLVLSMDFSKSNLYGCINGPPDQILDIYRNLIQDLLIYAEWLCSDYFNRNKLIEGHTRIQQLMVSIKKVVTRKSGLKLPKFHEMLHVCRDIRLFGPPDGYDGRPGESAHKQTKVNARKTQRRNNLFEGQTASRIYESLLIDSFHSHRVQMDNPHLDFLTKDIYHDVDYNSSRSQYCIFMDMHHNITSSAITDEWKNSTLTKHLEVCLYIYNTLGLGHSIKIPCKNLYKKDINDPIDVNSEYNNRNCNYHIFRSNPFMIKEEWYDWAWFRWDDEDGIECDVPANFFSFVDLRNIDVPDETLFTKGYSKSIYACIRSLKEHPKELFEVSKILFQSSYEEIPDKYRLVEVNCITNSCYVIPHFGSLEICDYSEWVVLENRYNWGDYFI